MTFLQKRLLPPIPRRVYWDKYVPHPISRKRKKRKTINIIPHLAPILVTDNRSKKKIKKKIIWSRKD